MHVGQKARILELLLKKSWENLLDPPLFPE